MDERRAFPRFKLGVEVHWKKAVEANERVAQHISRVKDVSAGGICLVLDSGIVAGDILHLEIIMPGRECIRCKGKVVWMVYDARVPKKASVVCEGGVEFLDIDESTRKGLLDFTVSSFINEPHK